MAFQTLYVSRDEYREQGIQEGQTPFTGAEGIEISRMFAEHVPKYYKRVVGMERSLMLSYLNSCSVARKMLEQMGCLKEHHSIVLLRVAVEVGCVEVVKILVSKGFNVDMWWLDRAKKQGNTEVVEYLESVGAKSGREPS